jgi:hypothetical protein
MDPLSDVLSLPRPCTYLSNSPSRKDQMLCGSLWPVLALRGSIPEALTAGDCFLLPGGLSSCLTSDLTLTAVDAHMVFPFPLNKAAIRWSLERIRDEAPHTLANAASPGQKSLITFSGHTGAQSPPELAFECEST